MVFTLTENNLCKLLITMEKMAIPRFATVLQAGFFCSGSAPTTIASLLDELPGFSEEYRQDRLQTVFLNGNAIDSFDQIVTGSPCTIALSAAMPGLAGALFKKESPLRTLRRSALPQVTKTNSDIMFHIKYFNDIAIERGPDLLARGVLFRTKDLHSFLELRSSLMNSIKQITLNGCLLKPAQLSIILLSHNSIFLSCRPAND
ncbi:MAG: hypothetical protein CR981_03655 [Proteobacteria bacterium]|nr:MAG: hypothetical protein CR981_03655 [Pseudomonadota bacterium]